MEWKVGQAEIVISMNFSQVMPPLIIKEANVAVCNAIKGQGKQQSINHVDCHPLKLAS